MKEWKPEELERRAILYAGAGGGFISFASTIGALAVVIGKFLPNAGNTPLSMGLIAGFLFLVGFYLTNNAYILLDLSKELLAANQQKQKVEELYGPR